jgi:L-ascorbate metabolism protein UlaG (beta-lactamase superfamily)
VKQRNIASKSIYLAIAMGVASLGCAGLAAAQSTDGNIIGTAVEGETIVLRGDMGVTREIHIEKTGKFSVRHLPVGTYDVIRTDASGKTTAQVAVVLVGKSTRVQ